MPKNIKNLQRVLPKPTYEEKEKEKQLDSSFKKPLKFSVLDLMKRDFEEDLQQ